VSHRKTVSLKTVQGEAHCNECGVAFFDGEQAYCTEEEDGNLIWFCDDGCLSEHKRRCQRDRVSLKTVQGEAHCNECGVAFFDGEQAYCTEEEDGNLIWFCDDGCLSVLFGNRQLPNS